MTLGIFLAISGGVCVAYLIFVLILWACNPVDHKARELAGKAFGEAVQAINLISKTSHDVCVEIHSSSDKQIAEFHGNYIALEKSICTLRGELYRMSLMILDVKAIATRPKNKKSKRGKR